MRRRLVILAWLCAATVEAGFDWDPVYERESATNRMEFLAVRPFYSQIEDPATERWRKDYLWPFYTQKGFKDEQYGRFLFFGYSTNFSEDDARHRVWVIPFYYQGVDANDEGYFAIFPIGGTIHEFLGRDKVMFVLFPIYGKSQVNDVRTTTVLWPIGSKSSAPPRRCGRSTDRRPKDPWGHRVRPPAHPALRYLRKPALCNKQIRVAGTWTYPGL